MSRSSSLSIAPQTGQQGPIGIIDIGSNSIRLVVYDSPARIPAILLNEKVMAGLGRGLSGTGRLDAAGVDRAYAALARFQLLARQIGVGQLHVVATAAVRDASNGPRFLARLAEMGLDVTLLSGDEEAEMSAQGVLAGIPEADGIVADLGGGSLELARIAGGAVHERGSFPLGTLRVGAIRKRGPRALRKALCEALKPDGWIGRGAAKPLYLVGGSWRALAKVDMHRTGYPLPIVHQYQMPIDAPARLLRALGHFDKKALKILAPITSGRAATLPDATLLLASLIRELKSAELIVSANGLREGVLHAALPAPIRDEDPLIAAARDEGRRQGRFPEHGDLLDRWIAPLFADESAADSRLRQATCLLGDIGWRAHPDFRAERGLETALHGNWVGVDARGRAMMAQSLYISFGGDTAPEIIAQLCSSEDRARACRWGLAMRLGQRLSGGVAPPLKASRVGLAGGTLKLHLTSSDAPLYGEAVERRHRALAEAFGAEPVLVVD